MNKPPVRKVLFAALSLLSLFAITLIYCFLAFVDWVSPGVSTSLFQLGIAYYSVDQQVTVTPVNLEKVTKNKKLSFDRTLTMFYDTILSKIPGA